MIRLCYIKAGDVVEELRAVQRNTGEITGGPNYYVYSTKHELQNDAVDILYLSLSSKSQQIDYERCRAKTFATITTSRGLLRHFGSLIAIFQIVKDLLIYRPNHIVCVTRPWMFVIFAVAKILRSGFTASVHTDMESKNTMSRILQNVILPYVDSVICHGPYLHDQAKKITNNKVHIIEYNASCKDILRHQANPSSNFLKLKGKRLIAFVGRVKKRKGVHDLYEACLPLLHEKQDLILCYAGGGTECDKLRTRALQDGCEAQVMVLGRLERKQVAELLGLAWAAVMPTRSNLSEGRCMAAMEALALGVPIVVPDLGPFPYLVQHEENGLLFRPDSVESLREQLVKILQDDVHDSLALVAKERGAALGATNLSYGKAVKKCMKSVHALVG